MCRGGASPPLSAEDLGGYRHRCDRQPERRVVGRTQRLSAADLQIGSLVTFSVRTLRERKEEYRRGFRPAHKLRRPGELPR